MIRRLILSIVLLAVSSAGGAVIQTSVVCVSGGQEERSSTHCAVGGPQEFAEAEARAGLDTPSPSYGYRAFITAAATAGRDARPYGLQYSEASASLSALLTTVGNSRPGWLEVSKTIDLDLIGEWAAPFDSSMIIGSYAADLYSSADEIVPFTLGESFPFEMQMWNGVLLLGSELRPEYTHISLFARVQFALYEADGVTPVVASEVGVPEPVWTGAGGALLLIVAGLLRRRRRHS